MRPLLCLPTLAIAVSICSLAPRSCFAEADLMIYPTRVVLGDKERTAQVDVINTSRAQAIYKITLVRKRMTEAGEFTEIVNADPDERFADDLIKYSPRQVTLLPGASQTVRLMFKAPKELPEGEYRSHLLFTKLPSAVTDIAGKTESEQGALSMHFDINVGISIPVIARHGRLNASAAIDSASIKLLSVQPDQQLVAFTLSRIGTRSIYGDAIIFRGDDKIAEGKGLAVYTPNKLRKVGLHIPDQIKLKSGDTLRVVFKEREGVTPLAEATTVIP